MKRYTSVVMLTVGRVMNKVIALWILSGVLETVLFLPWLEKTYPGAREYIGGRWEEKWIPYSLDSIFNQGHIELVFKIFLVILLLLLTVASSRGGEYTLRRLNMSTIQVNLLIALSNAGVLVIFLVGQAVILSALNVLYINRLDAASVNELTGYLSFYRVDLLHSLIPMEDVGLWVRNILLILGLGMSTAQGACVLRRGGRPIGAFLMMALAFFFWIRPAWELESDGIVIVAVLMITVFTIMSMVEAEAEEEATNEGQSGQIEQL